MKKIELNGLIEEIDSQDFWNTDEMAELLKIAEIDPTAEEYKNEDPDTLYTWAKNIAYFKAEIEEGKTNDALFDLESLKELKEPEEVEEMAAAKVGTITAQDWEKLSKNLFRIYVM